MILIDTNIFLEYLLGQQRADDCLKAIEKIISDEIEAVITSFSLHSIEVIMLGKGLKEELKTFLAALSEIQYITLYNTSLLEDRQAIVEMERTKLDFDDAVQFCVARKLKATILTLDKHFRKLKEVTVLTP